MDIIQEYGKAIIGVLAVIFLVGVMVFVGKHINASVNTQLSNLDTKTNVTVVPTPGP